MRNPGEYALMWANRHINKVTWAELVLMIRQEGARNVSEVDCVSGACPPEIRGSCSCVERSSYDCGRE